MQRVDPEFIIEENFERIFGKPARYDVKQVAGAIEVTLGIYERYKLTPKCISELLRTSSLNHGSIVHKHLRCGHETARAIMERIYSQ